ncbi:hypothetical protein AB0D49_41025 [Streptomyces sp. NPDC048290]|uniref:hypothetical protein n=1 Tax=Streptomyces sp. NPDC048290 TaxID=3155811 RepID=UPI0034368816
MALGMIPDREGREVAFEPLLDTLLALFSPSWVLPELMAGEHPYHRCEVKRWESWGNVGNKYRWLRKARLPEQREAVRALLA